MNIREERGSFNVPIPLPYLVRVTEGLNTVQILKFDDKDNNSLCGLEPGQQIRIYHPYHSLQYTIIRTETNDPIQHEDGGTTAAKTVILFIDRPYHHIITKKLREKALQQDSIQRLHQTTNYSKFSNNINNDYFVQNHQEDQTRNNKPTTTHYQETSFIANGVILQNKNDVSHHLEQDIPDQAINMYIDQRDQCIISSSCNNYQTLNHVSYDRNNRHENNTHHSVRVWKLIPHSEDNRLRWRRDYDDGFIPWTPIFTQSSGYAQYFRIKLQWCQIEEQCADDYYYLYRHLHFPNPSQTMITNVHQQRLHYFEKVSLDSIIRCTFHTICQQWYPISYAIDNFKWTQLARKVKFLDSIQNSQHEVDMAFLRHARDRKLNLAQFQSIIHDLAFIKFPFFDKNNKNAHCTHHESLARFVWTTIALLPQVNSFIWRTAQEYAVQAEMIRTCAQIRLSAFIRSIYTKRHYHSKRIATIVIQKYVRRYFACKLKKQMVNALENKRLEYFKNTRAISIQTIWRRYFCIKTLFNYKQTIEQSWQNELTSNWERIRREGSIRRKKIIFRKVLNIQSILTLTTMILCNDENKTKSKSTTTIKEINGSDDSYFQTKIEIQVYVYQTQRTFKFKLCDDQIRSCLEAGIDKKGPLSWNEMFQVEALTAITQRLTAKIVRKHPYILFIRRDVAERGRLIARRWISLENYKSSPSSSSYYVAQIYRSPFDVVIRLYNPFTCESIRAQLEINRLVQWIIQDEKDKMRNRKISNNKRRRSELSTFSTNDASRIDDANEEEYLQEVEETSEDLKNKIPILLEDHMEEALIKWLLQRISVRQMDDVDTSSREGKCIHRGVIVFQYQAEAEYKIKMAIVIQSNWRTKQATIVAQCKTHSQYTKIYDRSKRQFYYLHIPSGTHSWFKPKILGKDDDIEDPPNEWQKVEYYNEEAGMTCYYYNNPYTGQSSWYSEEEAARILQRKTRQRQSTELLGCQLDFRQVVKTVMMIRETELKYHENPSKLSNQVNYALLCFCILFDLKQSRSILQNAMVKSPNHPLISRIYAIFLLSSCEFSTAAGTSSTFEKACELLKQANCADPDQKLFQAAKQSFFHWSVVMNPTNPMSLLNYALMHQCVLKEYYRAENIYKRALASSSTKSPCDNAVKNFDLFLDQRYPGGYYYTNQVPMIILQRSHEIETRKEWGEWKKMMDPYCEKVGLELFWLNILTKESVFEEPNWDYVWKIRIKRSRLVTSNKISLRLEYYDEELDSSFIFHRNTGLFSVNE